MTAPKPHEMPQGRAVRPVTGSLGAQSGNVASACTDAPSGTQDFSVAFEVSGTPVGFVRMTQRSKWQPGPQRYLAYRSVVSAKAKEAMRGEEPYAGKVAVGILIFVHKMTFDVDNIIKCALDSMNKIVYRDDKQVRAVDVDIREVPRSELEDAVHVFVMPKKEPQQ